MKFSGIRMACAAFFAAAVCWGCLMQPSSESAPADPLSSAEKDVGPRDPSVTRNTDVPLGCSRVWNAASSDSVLYCPEVAPPKPQ